MKNYLLAAALLFNGSAATVYANPAVGPVMTLSASQDKVAVRPEDLPEAVKSALSGDAYSGWRVNSAFLITKEDNSQYFEINLQKDGESMTAHIDKYGKKID